MQRLFIRPDQLLRHQLGHFGRKVMFALTDLPNRANHFLGIGVFGQIAFAAQANQTERILIGGIAAQNQHSQIRRDVLQIAHGINAVFIRHRYVQYHRIKLLLSHPFERLLPRACFGTDA